MRRLFCAVGVCLLLAACRAVPTAAIPDHSGAALDRITVDALQRHVEYLAHDDRRGRATGEAGYDEAANYVAEQLAAIGAEPGGESGWYQTVELRTHRIDADSSSMAFHGRGEVIELAYGDEFSMQSDAIRPESSIRAEVVYVGYGVHAPDWGYSDYDGIDVTKKIVAIVAGAPATIESDGERGHYASSRTKRQEAASRGAVGLITLRTPKQEKNRPWDQRKSRLTRHSRMSWVSPNASAAEHHADLVASATLSTATAERLFSLSPLSFEQALDGIQQDKPMSVPLAVEVSMSQRSLHSSITSPNVIGAVRGTDSVLADEYVVYTAHLDHIGVDDDHGKADDETTVIKDGLYNGAYDNAMGISLMLETARAIAAAPPKRSVLFIALTAEEKGLLGSDYFVNNPTVPIDSIVANINLDMPLFLYPVADLVAFGSRHSSLHGIAEAAAAAEGFVFSPDPIPKQMLFVRSDQYSFVKAGIPAVYLMTGFASLDGQIDGEALFREHLKNHYHKPSDDLTRPIDWDSALRFARTHTLIGYAVGSDAERPTWNAGDFYGEKFGRR